MSKKIGIIADTVTDTKMGGVFFEREGYDVVMRPVKENSVECTRFFQEPPKQRDSYITLLINEIKAEGAKAMVFYANSICGYIDVERLCAENDIAVITPFQAYKRLGKTYKKPCVWAATVGALEGIESSLRESNPNIEVCGVSILSAAICIENGLSPDEVIRKNGLKELTMFGEQSGCDSVILGCTHFPYLMPELLSFAKIPVLDPVGVMLDILKEKINSQ